MSYKFNPFTGNFDDFNGPDGEFSSINVEGDINLDDGGTFTTTLQTITPTAAQTISLPDATGTVGLVGGSSGNLVVNQSGAYAGVANSSVDNATGNITLGSRFISSLNGAASAPPGTFTGTWFTGGTSTTTKPQVLIEPTGTTSTGWSTSGTGFGVNAASGFAGRLLDLQLNGTSRAIVTGAGNVGIGTSSPDSRLVVKSSASSTTVFRCNAADDINIFQVYESPTGDGEVYIKNTSGAPNIGLLANGSSYIIGGPLGIGTTSPAEALQVAGNIQIQANGYVNAGSSGGEISLFSGGTLVGSNRGGQIDLVGGNASSDAGAIRFRTGTGTGGTAQTERLRITSAGVLQVADAGDITVGTTTGTKIGTATTQKLGFWDKTPVVQPTTGISGATFVADSGGSIHPTSTFDGYTIAQVVAALRQVGILA
jgi:hypothetical protein